MWARIQFKRLYIMVFSTSRFAPMATSSNRVLQTEKVGVSRGVSTYPLEEVMNFGVSRAVSTDSLEKVMIFGVSRGSQMTLGAEEG